jgi:nucleotide-binding universal stress UspA family protein
MYQKIMVPLDGSGLAECVFPHLEAFITAFSLKEVLLVRVVEPLSISSALQASEMDIIQKNESDREFQAREYLNQVQGRISSSGVDLRYEVIVGTVADSLIDLARKEAVDLILMATHGRSGITRWVMGSVADKILHSAKIPVLMIRARI